MYVYGNHFGAYKLIALECAKKILKTMVDNKKYPTHFAAQLCKIWNLNGMLMGQLVWGYK
jgi:hypothetical protein